jgi:dTMP kinase
MIRPTAAIRAGPTPHGQPGVLVVLEGIDRSGRSTHARRLEAHLRHAGWGVARTSLGTAALSRDPIRAAKRDRHPDPVELALLYAADLAERIDQVVVPSLSAGLVVIADRYCWTPMARAAVRGVDAGWLDDLFEFVPRPDAVLYLEIDAAASLARHPEPPDPFEAATELHLSPDRRESYRLLQERIIACFEG